MNDPKPLTLSVALITYNGEKYLLEQLESLKNQTRLPDELVVCDDGSTDGTLEILQKFIVSAPFPVRVFQNTKNVGPGFNFRKVFFLCEKDLVFFCDQDDVWYPDKLARAEAVFRAEPEVGLVLMNDRWVNAEGKPLLGSDHNRHVAAAIRRRNCYQSLLSRSQFGWAAHNMVCRTTWREVLFQKNAPETAECFDAWVCRTMGALSHVRVLLEPSVDFRRHGGNFTSHSKKCKNPIVLFCRMIQKRQNIGRLYERAASYRQTYEYLQTCGQEIVHTDVLAFYQRAAAHAERRAAAIARPFARPWIILGEVLNGRYFVYSKGLKDVLSDLLAWPQKATTSATRGRATTCGGTTTHSRATTHGEATSTASEKKDHA